MVTSIEKRAPNRLTGWWVLQLLIGIVFIMVGCWMVVYPEESYLSLGLAFAAGLVAAGFFELVFILRYPRELHAWGWHLAFALIDMGMGVYLLFYPAITLSLLPFLAGFWILVRGFLVVGVALDTRSHRISGWTWLMYIGVIDILLAIVVLSYPFVAVIGIVGYTALSLITFGILHIYFYFSTMLWKIGRRTMSG